MDLNPLKIDRGESAAAGRPRGRGRGRGRGLGWLIVLAIAVAAGWLFRRPLTDFIDGLRLPEVKVVRVSKTSALAASAVSGTAANGYIVASKRAALSADTPGRIVEMNVTEGTVVKKGQIVARLYAEEYRAQLQRAEADLQSARTAVDYAVAQRDATQGELVRLRASVDQAAADLEDRAAARKLAEIKLERAEKLVRDKIWTQQQVDDARTDLERARASESSAKAAHAAAQAAERQNELAVAAFAAAITQAKARIPVIEAERNLAQATLDKTEVRAPFDGIVVLKDAEVGEVVSPNSQGGNSRGSVATMVDWSSLEVQVELPETSLSAARVGSSANIYLDAYPDKLYRGKVLRIWPTANRQKATVEVRVGFDAPDELLKPEMGARVVFSPREVAPSAQPQADSIVIPRTSVVKVDGREGVFVLERDAVEFRSIELGEERSGRVQVKAGLQDGERIVADPPNSLRSGDRVQIQGG